MDFLKTYYNYLTIEYLLQTRLGILSFFYKRKYEFNRCDRYEKLSALNNRIHFIIVIFHQHVL